MSRGPGRPPIPTADLVAALQDLAELVGGRPKLKHLNAYGTHSRPTYYDRFGSWGDALEAAGVDDLEPATLQVPSELDRHPAWGDRSECIPAEPLLEDVRRVAEAIGRMPNGEEYCKLGLYHRSTVTRRFDGTWLAVCDALGYEPPASTGGSITAARLRRMDPEEVGLSPVGERTIPDGGNR